MIELKKLTIAYGGRTLFDNVSMTIGARDRIGLVGANGTGKSTLLKILDDQLEPDSGEIARAGWASTGYLRQEGLVMRGTTVLAEAQSAFAQVQQLRKDIDQLSAQIQTMDTGSIEYGEALEAIGALEHRLEELDGHRTEVRAKAILSGLGFREADFERDCGEFSGGWQMRIALSKLLLRQPSLLLLDEPTNHLDLPSLHWLERFLMDYDGAVLLVSHDRAFLDNLTNRTWALEHSRIEDYSGNYSFYRKESVIRREALERSARNQEKMVEQTERFIERFRYKATKANQVQSRIKQLDKVERIQLDQDEAEIHFTFPEPPRSGQVVAELEGIRKAYGDNLVLDGITIKLERGDRVAVVGVNGAGKSTLARILAGQESFEGERKLGHKAQLAFFAQDQADALDPRLTVLETMELAQRTAELKGNLRTILGAFLFRGDDVFKPVAVLSGGEKNRLALARMLLQRANLLVFDEPTNHLDMRSKDLLQEAIAKYGGTCLIVSHDRDFLDPLVTKVLEVDKQSVRTFWGNVSEYVAQKDQEEAPVARASTSTSKPTGEGSAKERRKQVAERNRRLAPMRKRAEKLEREVEQIDAQIARFEQEMAEPSFFQQGEQTAEKVREYESLKRKSQRASDEWTELIEQIEAEE